MIMSKSKWDIWFAWHPVRLGALGTGRIAFMEEVARNRCMGVTIYQPKEVLDSV